MHAALNMTEENFDTPSKPKPGRDSDARRLFAAQRLRLLMGAVPRHIAKGDSDPAYTPERLAKGIMGVEARCIMRNSRAFITRHESSAVWGERPDTGGICAFDLVPEFEVPGVTIGDRVQVIRRCSMPDSHGRPMIHGAVKYVVPRRTLALTFFVPVFDKAAAAAAPPPPAPPHARGRGHDHGGGLARAMRVAQAQAQAKGKGKGKAAYIDLRFEEEEAGAPAARRDLGEEMEAAAPKAAEEELEAEREMEMEAALAAARTRRLARAGGGGGFSDDEPGDAGPRPPLVSPAARPPPCPPPAPPPPTSPGAERQPSPSVPSALAALAAPPPSVRVPPSPAHPLAAAGHARRHARLLLATCPSAPPAPRAGRLSRRAQQRRERERQLLRDQRAEAEADHDDGQASESDGEPPRATRLELARAELAVQPREAPEIDMSKYDDVTTYSKDNNGSCARDLRPELPATFYVELPNLFVYDKLLAMTFHKTYESNPGSFEFTFSKEVLSGRTRTFVRSPSSSRRLPRDAVIPASPSPATRDSTGSACVLVMTHEEARERYAGYMNTCYIQGRLPAGIEEATETCDWPTVYGMLHPFMPNVVKHLADNGYVTADEFGYAAAVLYAFNLVGPWNFCDKPVFDREPRAEIEPPSEGAMLQYCGIIKGQSGTGKSMVTQIMTECLPPGRVCVYRPSKGSAFSEHGGEEAICMVMAEGLDPKACSEEELKMRSGDAYSRNFKNVRGDDVRTKATRKVLVIVCNSFPQLENRMLEFFARVVLIPLDHKPAKKRTYLHSDIRENELPALMVAAFTFAWKIIHALSDGKASCIQAFEPAWLRAQRLGFWQETASCPSPASSSPTAPVAGIVEYIARTEGPDTSAAVGADIENGRLDETLAGFGSWCRPYSYKLGGVWQTYIRGIVPKAPLSLGESQPALEAIAIPVAQFKDPAPDVGPFLVKPHTKGKGKRTRNSAPAFLPPQPPATAPQQRPGQQRIDEMLPRQGTPTNGGAGPSGYDGELGLAAEPAPALPGPGAVLTAIQGFGAQQEAERRALAARQAREAEERRQALGPAPAGGHAFRAELEAASARSG
eukprot:tig00000123_g6938.t1